jgi:hypothetical protein
MESLSKWLAGATILYPARPRSVGKLTRSSSISATREQTDHIRSACLFSLRDNLPCLLHRRLRPKLDDQPVMNQGRDLVRSRKHVGRS